MPGWSLFSAFVSCRGGPKEKRKHQHLKTYLQIVSYWLQKKYLLQKLRSIPSDVCHFCSAHLGARRSITLLVPAISLFGCQLLGMERKKYDDQTPWLLLGLLSRCFLHIYFFLLGEHEGKTHPKEIVTKSTKSIYSLFTDFRISERVLYVYIYIYATPPPKIYLFKSFFPRASERRVLQKEGGVNRSTYKRYLLTSSRI